MEETITTKAQKTRLPLVGDATSIKADIDIEAELKAFEESERERLGIKSERRQWVDNMLNPKVTRKERDHVTLLISGLTAAQDFLVEGALKGLGYKVHYFGMSDNAGLQTGKEFGNRGQCNPTYFTVGSLVKHLIDLRDKQGISTKDIIEKYVFFTAGACGPCRFGMYVTEYRKALRDAGFDGFRVMLFQQTGGLSQATGDDVGPRAEPVVLHRDHQVPRVRRRAERARLPHPPLRGRAGRHEPRHGERQANPLQGALRADEHLPRALPGAEGVRVHQGGQAPAEGEDVDHR
jgi:hypothetical protein